MSALGGGEVDGGEGCRPVVSVGPGIRQHSVISGVSNSHSDALDRPRPRPVGDEGHAIVEPVSVIRSV